MKTVFNRVLSLVMCLILMCSMMSVSSFGASAKAVSDYKTYAQNSTKENIHHLLDLLDDTLADANGPKNKLRIEVELLKDMNAGVLTIVKGVLNIFVKDDAIKIVDNKNLILFLDLSSVDAICKTLDNYRAVIELASNDIVNKILDLGILKNVNLDVFDEGMSREKSGDYKIFSEFLELANANISVIEEFFKENPNLGVIGSAVKLDFDVSTMLREGVVDALFEGAPNYNEIKNRALNEFDAFVYTDLLGLVSADGGVLEGIEITADTTIDHIITDAFNIFVKKYLIDIVKGQSFSFANLGEEYKKLDSIIQLDGEYSFDGIELTHDKSVLLQLNDVVGKVFAQVVPGFTGWTKGDYKNIGDNTRKLVKYIAVESGLGINTNVSDEALMLEILKIVFQAADTNGEKEIYELIKNTKSLTEMANKIVIHLSGKSYPADATYEHVFGDYVIEQIGGTVPLYDESGKAITAGSGKTVWEVLNSALNFFLIDKNAEAYLGKDFKKSQSFFEKFDILLDFTADDGTADFSSEKFIRGLFDCLFRMDLQGFVEATAAKALKFADDISVVEFLYNTVCNLVNNWSVIGGIEKQTSGHFEAAMKNEGLAKIVKAVITTLNRRVEGVASLVGVLYGALSDVSETVTEAAKDPTCTDNGYAPTKKCNKEGCNNPYFSGKGDTLLKTGHDYKAELEVSAGCATEGKTGHTCVHCGDYYSTSIKAHGHKLGSNKITKNPTCTAAGVRSYYCTECTYIKTEPVAAKGHKAGSYKTTVVSTYKTKGKQEKRCTVCSAKLDEKAINMLTLGKPSGVKATSSSTSSAKISWKKVTGAESYNVLYRTGSGKWTTVKTTKTSVTVKKLKAGTTYKFKVVAVAGGNKSAESSQVSATTKPAAVTLSRVNSKKKKEVIVEWKKVSGVTGYEVLCSTSKKFAKKSTKTVTIKKQKTVKTIIKKLKSKKKYYVKVRAYKTVNKVKVYGAYSKVKNIKCK